MSQPLQPLAVQEGEQVQGPPAPNVVPRKSPEDLDHGIPMEPAKQLVIEIGGDGKSHRIFPFSGAEAAASQGS